MGDVNPMEWSQLLATKRTRSIEGGRESGATTPGEVRTAFHRDFDRAVFSSSVRRLQDKAQVWPLERNDFVRTRLTHSLEVSAVARGLAHRVGLVLQEKKLVDAEELEAIGIVAATCGLLHDLGNPPFGHAGEAAIRAWFRKHLSDHAHAESLEGRESQRARDFAEFDGNPQTIRVVAHLQMLADHNGLNLTACTLASLLKYTARSTEVDKDRHDTSKVGFFLSEEPLVEAVREETGIGSRRHPIALLVEAADDIVYSTVDIEDGIKKGVIRWEDLKDAVAAELGGVTPDLFERAETYISNGQIAHEGASLAEARAQMLRTFTIGEHVAAASKAFTDNYDHIMSGEFDDELIKKGSTAALAKAYKSVGRKRIFQAAPILTVELMGERVIHDLMDFFWEAAAVAPNPAPKSSAEKRLALMSANYQEVFRTNAETNGVPYARRQLLVDWISGMTDSFATDLHRDLTNG